MTSSTLGRRDFLRWSALVPAGFAAGTALGVLPAEAEERLAAFVDSYRTNLPDNRTPETNAAVERWIEEHGFRVGGAPWESYVTDPAQHPDPADWRTEVYWPLAVS